MMAEGRMLLLLMVVAALVGHVDAVAWRHNWTSLTSMQAIDFGYVHLNQTQLEFVAANYRMFSMEKCSGRPTEDTVWAMAKSLRQIDPTFYNVFYWNVDLDGLHCYRAYDEYIQHPEWFLKDDNGTIFNKTGIPVMDYTVAAAREWWISVPLGGVGSPYADIIDGILADGFSEQCSYENVNAQRCAEIVAGRNTMLADMTALFAKETNGRAQVIGNGLSYYPGNVDHNLGCLEYCDGVMNEHYGVFEDLDPKTGKLNVTKMHEIIETIGTAAKQDKTVFVATWAGLLDGFEGGNPSFFNHSQPTTTKGWQAALLQYHEFALAEFLTVVEDNVWMQYELWYSYTQGAVACPEDPESCYAPPGWYPNMNKPIGKPLGPAIQQGNIYTRKFENAISTLDLNTPLNSRVTFH